MSAFKALRKVLEAVLDNEGPRPSADGIDDREYRLAEVTSRLRLKYYFTPDGRWTGCRGKRPS